MNIRKLKNIINISIIILTLIIITLIAFLSTYKITYLYSSGTIYNINQKLFDFRKNLGIPIQTIASTLSYLGFTIYSFFDQDIKNDMDAINGNIFNTNETSVINAKKVSFYKGIPVFKFNHNRSGSFLAIFISNNQDSITTLQHEFGHNIQQLLLGPIKYLLCIGLPSWQEWSNRSYYERPWEITADIFGGVTLRKHNDIDVQRGYSYLDISAIFSTLSYYFLIEEYAL